MSRQKGNDSLVITLRRIGKKAIHEEAEIQEEASCRLLSGMTPMLLIVWAYEFFRQPVNLVILRGFLFFDETCSQSRLQGQIGRVVVFRVSPRRTNI